MSIIIIYTFVFIVQILYASCSFHACLPVKFAVCFCISYHHLIILYIVFVQILTLICSVLFAYLLAVFFIVQIHYASSCFVVCFFSIVGRTPELADCATVQPLCSSCAFKISVHKKNLSWGPFLPQCVNHPVFNVFLVEHFSSSCTESPVELKMTAEDENALRYTCFPEANASISATNNKSNSVCELNIVLSGMAVAGRESSFSEYTTEWIHQVDCGGLFHVSEQAYFFFRALELKTRITLPDHLKLMHGSKQSLICDVMEDEDVQTCWTMIAVDINGEEDAQELLQNIVELWLTIRGFSTTAVWLEEYKRALKKTTKKSKSLCRGLKDGKSVKSFIYTLECNHDVIIIQKA